MVIRRTAEGGSAIETTDYPLIDTERGICRPFVDHLSTKATGTAGKRPMLALDLSKETSWLTNLRRVLFESAPRHRFLNKLRSPFDISINKCSCGWHAAKAFFGPMPTRSHLVVRFRLQ